MINKRLLKCDQLVLFSYLKKENDHQGYCICNSNATKLINLNEVEFLKKKRIITDVYGFEKGGFEETSSNKKESFDIINKNEMCSSLSLSC